MNNYTNEQIEEAVKLVSSTISNCEKMQVKFAEGTSQHTLLKNRIKALYISKDLLINEDIKNKYTKEELEKALPPVTSIISKSETGISKAKEGTSTYTRFRKIINAMSISKELIVNELNKEN